MAKHATYGEAGDLMATPLTKAFGGSMTNAVAVGEACTKTWLEWQEEWLGFVGARLKSDVEAQKCLAECENLSDAAKIQQDWLATAGRAYFEEAGKLMQITTRAARDGFARLQDAGKGGPEV
ncbi:MAG: phasin family protein [Alphaproteobacteria bacterium]|nr:phasin family protein [Alphaproteobacteria bacterium]